MKKLLVILAATAALALTGCEDVKGRGNHNIVFGEYTYKHIHVQVPGTDEVFHDNIVRWAGDDGGIEIKGEKYGYFIIGDGMYMMYNYSTCPLCGYEHS